MAKICQFCGTKNDDKDFFCQLCGEELNPDKTNFDDPIQISGSSWIGTLIKVIIVLAVVGVIAYASWNFFISPTLNDNYLEENGINGTAVILDAKQTQVYVNDNPQIRFKLMVTVPGKEPYEANYTTVVAYIDMPKVQPGERWYVLVDPKDPQNVKFA